MATPFNSIEEAIRDIKKGKFIILVDDEDRENEGDLVMAASKVTPQAVNFMAKHARGLICLALTPDRVEELQLAPQAAENTATFGTAFTVSVDARKGITTGISAADRATTILEAAGIACHGDPGDAARTVAWLDDWSKARRLLLRVPEHTSADIAGKRADAAAVFACAAAEHRRMLTEVEAKTVLAAYGVPVPATTIAADTDEAERAARALFDAGHAKVVVKMLSRTVTHKSDLGGVVLDLATPQAARDAAVGIASRFAAARPGDALDGFAVQPMVVKKRAHELIVGVTRDRIFGPAILFGAGDHRTRTEDRAAPPDVRPTDALRLGPLRARVVTRCGHPRLIEVEFEGDADAIWAGIARHGRPVGLMPSSVAICSTRSACSVVV